MLEVECCKGGEKGGIDKEHMPLAGLSRFRHWHQLLIEEPGLNGVGTVPKSLTDTCSGTILTRFIRGPSSQLGSDRMSAGRWPQRLEIEPQFSADEHRFPRRICADLCLSVAKALPKINLRFHQAEPDLCDKQQCRSQRASQPGECPASTIPRDTANTSEYAPASVRAPR